MQHTEAGVADPHYLSRVLSVQRALALGRSTEAVTHLLLHGLRALGADIALMALLDERDSHVLLIGGTDVTAPVAESSRRVRLDDVSLINQVVAGGQRVTGTCAGDAGAGEVHQRSAERAADRVIVCFPLRSRERVLGAVVAYWSAPEGDLHTAEVDEAERLIALAGERLGEVHARESLSSTVDQLQHALDSRVLIEQAKGMVAQRYGIDTEAAFGHLRAYARDHNERIGGLAERLVAGHLDLDELGPADGRR